jgi:hypothetical protein
VELLPPDDPWAAYARTVVVIVRPETTNLVVEAAPPGRTGAWPWPTEDPVHILTAWDPGDARRGVEENRAIQAALQAELELLGPNELRDAVGVDPMSGHREEGVAVRGLALDVVLDLGARYGQDAVFEWTPPAWAVVACRGDRRTDLGWAGTPE